MHSVSIKPLARVESGATEEGTRQDREEQLVQAGELTFEAGVVETVRRIRATLESERTPLFIGVYGLPNSGKSYFVRQVAELCKELGIWLTYSDGAYSPEYFQQVAANPEKKATVSLCHYGSFKIDGYGDPDYLCRAATGRNLDLSVCLYNPNLNWKDPEGSYDIIIRNEASVEKPRIQWEGP